MNVRSIHRKLTRLPGLAIGFWASAVLGEVPVEMSDRLELFVDSHLIANEDNVHLRMVVPRAEAIAMEFNRPWEEINGMFTVIQDGNRYRLYYRGGTAGATPAENYEVTCYAESADGINWNRPNLGLHEFQGSRDNNIMMGADPRMIASTFTPFLDMRPGVPAGERYKAIGGVGRRFKGQGLIRFLSADGLHWREHPGGPILDDYPLDSQNVARWLPAERCYAIYLRTFVEVGKPGTPEFRRVRSISRSTSKDFATWTKPEPMSFGDTPLEHLYTQGTHPYFRAPHILIAMPFRFWPDRQVLSQTELRRFGVRPSQWQGISDAVFMTSRGGNRYDRSFMESFIRPGRDRRNWHARNVKPAFGVVPTGDDEMSIYVAVHNTLKSSHLRRYSMPLDRFASVNAPHAGGTLLTKSLVFSGEKLVINYSTSAAGSIRVELLDESGKNIPGYSFADSDVIIGDEIDRVVTWRGRAELTGHAGRPVRLRFHMADADLYALRFAHPTNPAPLL